MNVKSLLRAFFLMLYLATTGYAQFWKKVTEVLTLPATIPYNTAKGIIRGDNVGAVIQGQYQSAGRSIQSSSQMFQRAQDVFTRVPGSLIENSLGSDWRRGYEALNGFQRVQYELATTSGRYLGGCLTGQQCNVYQLVAGPVAASLRDSYKIYSNYATPLPPQIVQVLSRVVPYHILTAARWGVGSTPDFTVPGFLNAGNEALGSGGHAVTIGNVMIFSRWPDLNTAAGWNWLLHELRHIEQYKNYDLNDPFQAIDGFSVEYVRNWKGLEQDAESVAQNRLNALMNR